MGWFNAGVVEKSCVRRRKEEIDEETKFCFSATLLKKSLQQKLCEGRKDNGETDGGGREGREEGRRMKEWTEGERVAKRRERKLN